MDFISFSINELELLEMSLSEFSLAAEEFLSNEDPTIPLVVSEALYGATG